tara:strand:+ start:112 stop:360 length:249 start_codon:yes stop_codon:yes gene_type:complete
VIQKKNLQLLIVLSLFFILLYGCNTARGTSKGSKIMSEGVVTIGQGGVKVVEGITTIVRGTVPIFDGFYEDAKTLGRVMISD